MAHLAEFFAQQCSNKDNINGLPCAYFSLSQPHPTFDFTKISEITVLKYLKYLPIRKSTADKLLSNLLLRERAPCIAASLSYLFNLSFSTCKFP